MSYILVSDWLLQLSLSFIFYLYSSALGFASPPSLYDGSTLPCVMYLCRGRGRSSLSWLTRHWTRRRDRRTRLAVVAGWTWLIVELWLEWWWSRPALSSCSSAPESITPSKCGVCWTTSFSASWPDTLIPYVSLPVCLSVRLVCNLCVCQCVSVSFPEWELMGALGSCTLSVLIPTVPVHLLCEPPKLTYTAVLSSYVRCKLMWNDFDNLRLLSIIL